MIHYNTLSARRLLSLLFVLSLSISVFATSRKVLFIGNSYTYTNSMPDMFKNFAQAMGDTVTYTMSAPGGYTFQQHTTLPATLSGITSQPWDIVVLQEQSQLPSFDPTQVATEVYPYARWLDSFVNDYDSCIETMFMMTWGRKNGDASNCPFYTPVCTYAGMQGRLRESYMEMAFNNHASVAPVGAAWKIIVDSFSAIDLYSPDESHPSVAGSYLQACVFYTSIFHRSAQGCTYLGGLTASVAATLQRIADKVVLDSLSLWQQHGHYPYAAFTHATTGFTVNFTNNSQRGTGTWAFGDGGTSATASPTHTYTASGIYTVTLTVTNDCFSVTRKDTVHIGTPTAIYNTPQNSDAIKIARAADGTTIFTLTAPWNNSLLEIYDMNGRLVTQYAAGLYFSWHFPPGLYVYRYIMGNAITTGKFTSY